MLLERTAEIIGQLSVKCYMMANVGLVTALSSES
jgi:hypothetical protein